MNEENQPIIDEETGEEFNYLPDGSFPSPGLDPVSARIDRVERLLHVHRHTTADRTQPLRAIQPAIRKIATAGSTYTIGIEEIDMLIITAQDAAVTFSNPTHKAFEGQKLLIRIQDNGTARAITWGSMFRSTDATLPTTTVVNKQTYCGLFYNADDLKWDLVATVTEA